MEGRDGLNCALKAGCSTSDADTQLLGASSLDVLMDSPRQTSRETGPRRSLPRLHRSKTDRAHKKTRPRDRAATLTKNADAAGCLLLFPFTSRGIPVSGSNNPSILIPPCVFWERVLLRAADFSPVLRSVWLEIVQWRSSFPPVMRPTLWSRHSRLLFTGSINSELAAG